MAHYSGPSQFLSAIVQTLTRNINELCRYNDILNLVDLMPDIESGLFNLSYPLTFDPQTFEQYNLPASLGGLTVSDLGTVSSAAALSLTFFLDVTEDWQTTVGGANTNSLRSKLFHWKNIVVCRLARVGSVSS